MPRKPAKRRVRTRLIRGAIIAVAAFVVLSLTLVLPLRWLNPPTSAFMLQDRSGRIPVLFDWEDLQSVGTAAALAVVASEDQKFTDHFGFDLQSIESAIENYESGETLRGASTISQQVAKNLYLWPGRNLLRKGLEAWLTVIIEASWSKQRILEVYLNVAELGPGIYGFPAASRYYFDRDPNRLSDAQAALLAAVLPNPHTFKVEDPSRYVRERQQWVMRHVERLRREQWIMRLN